MYCIHWVLHYSDTDCFPLPDSLSISNNPSFRLQHPGVPDGSDGSGRTSYPLTENQTRPVAQATGRVAYLPCGGYYTMPPILATHRVVYYARRSGVRLPLPCVLNVVTYTHHRTTRMLHSSQGLQLCSSLLYTAWRCLCLSSADSHMPHSHLCLALRFCHLLQYSLRFAYIACHCIGSTIIVFYMSEIYCPIFTLSSTMPSVLTILR
jgi:hypothetical protein